MSTITINTGTLNLPGSTLSSKKTAENLLAKDLDLHNCFFNQKNFHNHLSHHILAAYDLGASADLLKAIYDEEAKKQRPILLDRDESVVIPGEIDRNNWKKYLGNNK